MMVLMMLGFMNRQDRKGTIAVRNPSKINLPFLILMLLLQRRMGQMNKAMVFVAILFIQANI